MTEMPYAEKRKLPYSLLLDPLTERAAAYTSNHRLIAPLASAELVAFARGNASHQAPWNEALRDPTGLWRPLPDWATPEVRQRCVLIWIRHGLAGDDYFASIPKK